MSDGTMNDGSTNDTTMNDGSTNGGSTNGGSIIEAPVNHAAALARLVRFYETIDPAAIARLNEIYAPDAQFKDPFNEVQGLAAISRIFRHMYEQVDAPRFAVRTRVLQDADAFLTWNFTFRMKRFSAAPQCIRGATHLCFDGAGLVTLHRDYWDAAEELYEKLPVLGALMRFLKARGRS
ncbi:MAG: nuclear transport factor 2 family protein [Massilia sp.]